MTIGKGFTDRYLGYDEIVEICEEAFSSLAIDNKKLLFVIPDHTRSAPIDKMFKAIYHLIADKVAAIDFIVALGTHPPMSDEMINERVGITAEERTTTYSKARFFNHYWKKPGQLVKIGRITHDEVKEISGGLMDKGVDISINKIIFDYDKLVIVGPTFPHEVVGFSGGNKYLFPGISGSEIIDMFHWLGALITSPRIIGNAYTPVRAVVDKAAKFIKMGKYAFSLVVKGHDNLAGLYFGSPESAWAEASRLSDKLHIIYKDKPYKRVLSKAPLMYDDLWVGAKCMYKLEPVVADGGEVIIYAPHIKEISVTHGEWIEKIGYHCLPYFLKQMDKFKEVPGGIMAHSTHVRGLGGFDNGVETPRINVTLATGIPEEICHKVNLGYMNPDEINEEAWMDREDEGILYVPKAGEMLYRLKNDPFKL
ncbi:MAG: lactate racemase domain-containing protein [Fidelibacterota bacterium]